MATARFEKLISCLSVPTRELIVVVVVVQMAVLEMTTLVPTCLGLRIQGIATLQTSCVTGDKTLRVDLNGSLSVTYVPVEI